MGATQISPITPGKLLNQISPTPILNQVEAVRKNLRALATVLNSPDNIVNMRNKKRRKLEAMKSKANFKRKTKGKTKEKSKQKEYQKEATQETKSV